MELPGGVLVFRDTLIFPSCNISRSATLLSSDVADIKVLEVSVANWDAKWAQWQATVERFYTDH